MANSKYNDVRVEIAAITLNKRDTVCIIRNVEISFTIKQQQMSATGRAFP